MTPDRLGPPDFVRFVCAYGLYLHDVPFLSMTRQERAAARARHRPHLLCATTVADAPVWCRCGRRLLVPRQDIKETRQ